jgi:hypothetical protein
MTLIGDNSMKLTEEERRSLFFDHARKIMGHRAQIKALQALVKDEKKLANIDGFASSKLDHFVKTMDVEDKQKPVDKLKSDQENLVWLGLIKQPSGDLFDADRVSKEQMAFQRGYLAGAVKADDFDSGYQLGSTEDKEWHRGYKEGVEEQEKIHASALAKKAASSAESAPTGEDPFPGDEEIAKAAAVH